MASRAESQAALSAVACPKCSQRMIQGFLPDVMEGAGRVISWVEGPPPRRLGFGFLFRLNWGRLPQAPVTAWRCPACGFLELYAKSTA